MTKPNSTKAGHSLAPWTFKDNGEFENYVIDANGHRVCWPWYHDNPEQDIANAALIAAAPELLEALKEIMMERNFVVYCDHLEKHLKKVIAKAEGRS